MNYVFYVSDVDSRFATRHQRKMDLGHDIAEFIGSNLKDTQIMKTSEYTRELINAESVGIIMPSYMWGISYSLISFIKSLRVTKNTYVYMMVMGQGMELHSARSVDLYKHNGLEQINQISKHLKLDIDIDCYFKCEEDDDYIFSETELGEKKSEFYGIRARVYDMLSIIKFHNISDVNNSVAIKKYKIEESDPRTKEKKLEFGNIDINRIVTYTNVFLEDEYLSGIRLCSAI